MPRKKGAAKAWSQNLLAAREKRNSKSPKPGKETANDSHEHTPSLQPALPSTTELTPLPLTPTSDAQTLNCDESQSISATFTNLRGDSDHSERNEPLEGCRNEWDDEIEDEEDRYEENSDGEELGSDDEAEDGTEDESPGLGVEDDNASHVTNNQPIPIEEAEKMILALEKILKDAVIGRGRHKGLKLDDVTRYRIRLMLQTLRMRCVKNCGLIKVSMIVAELEGRKLYVARRIRQWIRHFQASEMLPENLYGRRWNESLVEDQEFRLAIKAYLLTIGKYAQARDIVEFFGTSDGGPYFETFGGCPSLLTAQDWMGKLGYGWGREQRGQYADGHERPDVVEYRMKHYIPEWVKHQLRMRSWDREGKEIPPVLGPSERVVVVWFHDESTFFAHDCRTFVWQERGKALGIQKKGEGLSLMVARFVSPDYGWLRGGDKLSKLTHHALPEHLTRASRDSQFTQALDIVKEMYPDEEHLFVFDNATIHTKLPDTAPSVYLMTLGALKNIKAEITTSEGEKIKVNMAPARFADGSPQELYYPSNYLKVSLRGQFKGLTKLLEERGIPGARKLKLQCPKDTKRNGCPPGRIDCCARRTMANQPDFLKQKTALQILAESRGCSLLYLPKYHCELNPIEQCWGADKRVYRVSLFSSAEADLRRNMLVSLDSVSLASIRRFSARSQRFLYAYRDGISGADAIYAQKKYHGHRVATESVMRGQDESG